MAKPGKLYIRSPEATLVNNVSGGTALFRQYRQQLMTVCLADAHHEFKDPLVEGQEQQAYSNSGKA